MLTLHTTELASAQEEIQRLREANRQLTFQAEKVADANAYAAEIVAELEMAKSQIEEKENYLKTIFESLPVGIMTVDPRDYRILDINEYAAQMIGTPRLKVVGQTCRSVFCPGGNGECPIKDLGQSTDRSERNLLTHGGGEVPVLKCVTPMLIRGQTIYIETFVDIRDRKAAETQMKMAQEAAEGACRAKSEFLANMSHEIRTPMNGVLGLSDVLLDTELSSQQREYLTMVKSSAHSLLSILNDILDCSKLEAGALQFESIEFDLGRVIEESLSLFEFQARERGLRLSCEVDSALPQGLVGDPGRLRQILVNLIGNAFKFTEHGEVALRVIPVLAPEGEYIRVHFSVRDTGIGIPIARQNAIFEAFQQVDSSVARNYGGTGLGLTISRQLVHRMGGEIWLESHEGLGTIFHFTARFGIPCQPGSNRMPSVPEIGVAASGAKLPSSHRKVEAPLRILVAEDNAVNQKVITAMLEKQGHTVTIARNGREAVNTSARQTFDLILMDVQMPVMDGLESTAAIRKREKDTGHHVSIIALTAHAMKSDLENCLSIGMDGYLTKPITVKELSRAIQVRNRPI